MARRSTTPTAPRAGCTTDGCTGHSRYRPELACQVRSEAGGTVARRRALVDQGECGV